MQKLGVIARNDRT